MEALLLMWILGCIFKGFGKAAKGSSRKRRKKTQWDRLSYGQKAYLHDKYNGH